ncbi:SpoVR family protein [Bacillus horti]|uniref:Stage V sporulation protein R n=1 Tax=Caldalkalibacillus horti TaxID=77523 RepID=A0ABT9VW98_9BACI|nr:SpoVR family protein [Bacillus horti]MDQ0165170.1 stage V sporulation protein R [Bacillus horti]
MTPQEHKDLERAIHDITEIAEGFGLDFYPMRYEICPSDIIYTFGAYGMPTRFSHWSFGKAFHRMKLQYDLGLSKIYELVINSDPCYAFLLEGNSLIQNKLIVAHVLAHCDFFKNNIRFTNTSRHMVESMSASADRIRRYELEYGKDEVEKVIDAVLALQEHIDPSILRPGLEWKKRLEDRRPGKKEHGLEIKQSYDDLWSLDEEWKLKKEQELVQQQRKKRFPEKPEKDLLLFVEEYSSRLEEWQRDIITILRDEMLYFWPQLETKIMNEGWASYWHLQIVRELDLTEEEVIEFAKLNASVLAPSSTSINPYHLGYNMFVDIEKRFNEPTLKEQERYGRKPNSGRQQIFEIRQVENDSSFIRNYLTKQLVEDLDLYLFQKKGNDYAIVDKDWKNVRDQLVNMRVNGGFPYLMVEDGDYQQRGELLVKHYYEGMELDPKYIEKTLPYLHYLWGRTVHLLTIVDGKEVLYSHDDKKINRRFV